MEKESQAAAEVGRLAREGGGKGSPLGIEKT